MEIFDSTIGQNKCSNKSDLIVVFRSKVKKIPTRSLKSRLSLVKIVRSCVDGYFTHNRHDLVWQTAKSRSKTDFPHPIHKYMNALGKDTLYVCAERPQLYGLDEYSLGPLSDDQYTTSLTYVYRIPMKDLIHCTKLMGEYEVTVHPAIPTKETKIKEKDAPQSTNTTTTPTVPTIHAPRAQTIGETEDKQEASLPERLDTLSSDNLTATSADESIGNWINTHQNKGMKTALISFDEMGNIGDWKSVTFENGNITFNPIVVVPKERKEESAPLTKERGQASKVTLAKLRQKIQGKQQSDNSKSNPDVSGKNVETPPAYSTKDFTPPSLKKERSAKLTKRDDRKEPKQSSNTRNVKEWSKMDTSDDSIIFEDHFSADDEEEITQDDEVDARRNNKEVKKYPPLTNQRGQHSKVTLAKLRQKIQGKQQSDNSKSNPDASGKNVETPPTYSTKDFTPPSLNS